MTGHATTREESAGRDTSNIIQYDTKETTCEALSRDMTRLRQDMT